MNRNILQTDYANKRIKSIGHIYSVYKPAYYYLAKTRKERKEILINKFQKAHPELMKFAPIINITGADSISSTEGFSIIFDPPYIDIALIHPFIFDKRLIPSEFEGLKVNGYEHFENIDEDSMIESLEKRDECTNPEYYIKFVENNIALIREVLMQPNLTKNEALDALTGGFKEYKEWCKRIVRPQ